MGQKSEDNQCLISGVVPQEGLEPPHPCEYQILSLARLPVPPLGLRRCQAQRTGLPARSAVRYRRPATSFHEVGTVAKTDCKAKAVANRQFPQCPRSWRRRGRRCTKRISCDRAAHFRAQPNSDADYPVFALTRSGLWARELARLARGGGPAARCGHRRFCDLPFHVGDVVAGNGDQLPSLLARII